MIELESKFKGGDLVPVLIVGAIYGMLLALIVRNMKDGWHQAEISDLITQSICLGTEFQKEIDQHRKEANDKANHKKTGRSNGGTKSRSHKKTK